MIPKIIHYCWFGGKPLPPLALKCIESWQKYCPDYEIKRWDEGNFDINSWKYTSEAYGAKKWAFISDVARLYALVNYGGVYMDTDVELLKPIDKFLSYDAFSGFESEKMIPTGIMGSIPNHNLFIEFLQEYENISFKKDNGEYDTTTNVQRITDKCLQYNLQLNNSMQIIEKFALFPTEYFCPKSLKTGKITITNNTYAIHHFDGSWLNPEEQYQVKLRNLYIKYLPECCAPKLAAFLACVKYHNIGYALKKAIRNFKKKQ